MEMIENQFTTENRVIFAKKYLKNAARAGTLGR
jgi:hypothetical protein